MYDDDYWENPPMIGRTATRVIIAAAIIVVVWIVWAPSEGYRPCIGDCAELPKKPPLVVNPYRWPYSGATCLEDMYIMDRDVRGAGDYQPLVSLNTPDHVVMSSVSFVV